MYDSGMEGRVVDIVASGTVLLGGVALTFIHYYGGSPGDPEGWFAAFGFAAPFIGVGLVALVGALRRRPALMLAAGVALIPMSLLSVVLSPLIISAILLLVRSKEVRSGPHDLVVPALLASGLVTALAILVFHQDPVTWSTPQGTGGSSNIITSLEAAIAISVTAAVVLIAAFLRPVPLLEQ